MDEREAKINEKKTGKLFEEEIEEEPEEVKEGLRGFLRPIANRGTTFVLYYHSLFKDGGKLGLEAHTCEV